MRVKPSYCRTGYRVFSRDVLTVFAKTVTTSVSATKCTLNVLVGFRIAEVSSRRRTSSGIVHQLSTQCQL